MYKETRLISFQHVSLQYPNAPAPALRDFSLEVQHGEVLAVIGANGSGKSTFGRLCNALLLPTSGQVLVDGLSTTEPGGTAEARRRVAMVFQNPDSGVVSASVEEDVAFVLENQRLPRAEIAARVQETLDTVGLTPYRLSHPLSLTTSDRARLGLASAVVGAPRFLVMDEATAYLDVADRASLFSAVDAVRKRTGMGVILITHVMEEALAAHRVAVFAEGLLVYLGDPRELFDDPERARSWRLELPPLLQLADELRGRGVEVGTHAVSVESMVDFLCRS